MASPAEAPKQSPANRVRAFFGGLFGSDGASGGDGPARFETPQYPGAVDTGHSHRRLLWTARVLGVVCVGLALAVAALGWAIAALVPLKRVEIALLQVSPAGEQVVEVKPLRADIPVIDYMTRAWVREYVTNRNTIIPNADAMTDRLRWVRERSALPVWNEFQNNQRTFIREALDARLMRTVEVRTVTRDARRAPLWFVDFVVIDTYPAESGRPSERRAFRAQLFVNFVPRTTRQGDLDIRQIDNPFGFTVERYDIGRLADADN